MFNVLVVGQTGNGKSSVVNLIAGQNLAPTGDDLQHCTERCTEYPILVDGRQFQVFDTFGVLEPQVDSKLYTEAIADTYGAIIACKARGGIDMILYCIRDDKTNDLQKMKNYFRLFHEVLCDEEVPIAVVVTNRGSSPLSTLNAEHYRAIFAARNIAYVDCICVNVAGTHGLDGPVDTKSQEAIRRLLVKCCEVPESRSKLQQFLRVAKKLAGRGQSLKRKQVSTLLTKRCKMNMETAGLVVTALDLEAPSNRLYRAPYARAAMTRESLLSKAHTPEEHELAMLDASSGSQTPTVDNTTVLSQADADVVADQL